MPSISVIVPIYDVEPYICRCVDSILNQTFTDFELILVDDGSPDNCGKICDEYAQKDSRVFVIHQENGGLSAARNAGIDWAFANGNSEWITFIDSDDWVHQQYLESMYNTANFYKSDLCICKYTRDLSDFPMNKIKEFASKSIETETFYVDELVLATVAHCKLYKKYLFDNIRYPVGKIHEDTLTTYMILFKLKNVVLVDINLYFYYQNPNSITASNWSEKELSSLEANEQQLLFFKKRKLCRALSKIAQIYIFKLYNWIDMSLTSLPPKKQKKYRKIWRSKLRKCLIKYHSVCTFKKYEYIYEKAFPITMKVYYRIKAL